MMGDRVVLCFGDSNTFGTPPMANLEDMARFGPDVRWPGVCRAALGPGWTLIEEGHPGRTTVHPDPVSGVWKNGISVLPALLESHWPLDLVVIALGTNDLKMRFQAPPVEIAGGVERLVACVKQSFAGPGGGAPDVLIVCPPPILEAGCLAEIFAGGAERSRRLSGFYRTVAERHGAAFLDAGEVIVSSPLDGVHFDEGEHAKLGRAVAEALRARLG
jgi:lysophospholipase L1-like esterase